MHVDQLLDRLEGTRPSGRASYMAKCPAHPDGSPSLSIGSGRDGRILLYCFAGCDIEDVLSALSLTFSDLMPDSLDVPQPCIERTAIQAPRQLLKVLRLEALVVAIGAENLANGIALSSSDRNRLFDCACRIRSAIDAIL